MAGISGVPVYVASRIRGLASRVQSLLRGVDVHDIAVNEDGVVPQTGIHKLSKCEVLLCDPSVSLQMFTQSDVPLKWAHNTWAGVDAIERTVKEQQIVPKFTVTRSGQGFGQLIGEYVVGYIIAFERQFHVILRNQLSSQWHKVKPFRTLPCLTIGILGLGNIGQDVARMCKGLGMTVWGLSRGSGSKSASCLYVDEFRTDLRDLLPNCDYVCNVLPSTNETRDLLSGDILEHCKNKKSVFINVGRGDVVKEESLVKALEQSWLGGAVLDVFAEEPLSERSPLWGMENVFITPHIAGPSRPNEVSVGFVKNYQLYCADQPLKYQVDWTKGY